MAYVIAAPEMMTAAAADLATIGSNVNVAHMVAAAPTVAVIPAAADEVSAGIAHLFSQHAANYQALAGQAAAFQEQFVQHLTASAGSFAHAEAANIVLLQPLTAIEGSYASIETAIRSDLGGLLNGVGGYLIGGVGEPGLLPRIAFKFESMSNGDSPFPAVDRLLYSLTGSWPSLYYPLDYYVINALTAVSFPLDLLLLPWAFIYLAETGQLF